jgi:hypothetical protein
MLSSFTAVQQTRYVILFFAFVLDFPYVSTTRPSWHKFYFRSLRTRHWGSRGCDTENYLFCNMTPSSRVDRCRRTVAKHCLYHQCEHGNLLLQLLLFKWTANGFLPRGSGTTLRHNTQHIPKKITHHAQTNHSTQKCANNKGHTTHNEYKAFEISIYYN